MKKIIFNLATKHGMALAKGAFLFLLTLTAFDFHFFNGTPTSWKRNENSYYVTYPATKRRIHKVSASVYYISYATSTMRWLTFAFIFSLAAINSKKARRLYDKSSSDKRGRP